MLVTPLFVVCAVVVNAGGEGPSASQFELYAGSARAVAESAAPAPGAVLTAVALPEASFAPGISLPPGVSQSEAFGGGRAAVDDPRGARATLRAGSVIPSRAAFNAEYPFSPIETFEEYSGVGFENLDRDTIDSSTDNAFFNPGDIDRGLRITVADSSPGGATANFLMADETEGNYTSAAVTYSNPQGPPDIVIDFLIPSTAVAMDITGNPDGTPATVEVFSGVTSLGSFPVVGTGVGTFFGYQSTDRPITRVEIDGGFYNGVDNIAYSRLCEDFEEANIGPDGFEEVDGDVIDRYTNDGIFSLGDVAPQLRIVPTTPGNLLMVADGFANYVSDTVTYSFNNGGGPELEVLFLNGSSGFTFDLTGNPDGSVATVTIYSGATPLASVPFAGTGAGFSILASPPANQPITRMTIDNDGNGGFNGIDNICFDPCETLEEADLVAGGFAQLPDVLDAATNNSTFAAGSIAEGLTFRSLSPFNMYVVTNGFANYTSDTITPGSNLAGPELAVEFDGGASMVSMEITGNPEGSVANVEVFAGATSLGVFPVVGTGVGTPFTYSSSQPITRVTVDSPSTFEFNGVDNVCFVRGAGCDFNSDGVLNVDDIQFFVLNLPDMDGNTVFNPDDIQDFIDCFTAGVASAGASE